MPEKDKNKITHMDNVIGRLLTSKITHKANKKEQEPYGGKYSDIMEGEHLIAMRKAIENLAAGKITKKQYSEVKKGFLMEFPESAIKLLQADIDSDKAKKEKK